MFILKRKEFASSLNMRCWFDFFTAYFKIAILKSKCWSYQLSKRNKKLFHLYLIILFSSYYYFVGVYKYIIIIIIIIVTSWCWRSIINSWKSSSSLYLLLLLLNFIVIRTDYIKLFIYLSLFFIKLFIFLLLLLSKTTTTKIKRIIISLQNFFC